MWVLYFVKYFIVKSAFLAKTLHYSLRIVFLVQVHRRDVAVLYGVTHSLAESTRLCGGYNPFKNYLRPKSKVSF